MPKWWAVEPAERASVIRLWMAGLMLGGGILVAKTVSDTLLLSRTDLGALPRLYLIVAVVLFIGGWFYRLVADRWPKATLAWALPAAVAILLGAGWLTVWQRTTNYVALYCLVELGNALSVISFWALLTEQFTSTQGKRLFALIGSGVTAGAIVGGLLVSAIAALRVADELLLLAGLLFAAEGVVISRGTWSVPQQARPAASQVARPASTRLLLSDRQVRLLALLTVALLIATTLTDYQWKRIVAAAYQEAHLAQFYGALYVPMNALALALQGVLAGRVIMRLGSVWALACLPVGLSAGAIGILINPAVLAAIILEASDKLINRTVHNSAMQLQFIPIESSRRGQVKALVDGQVRPAAKAFGAVALMLVSGWLSVRNLSWLVLVLLGGSGLLIWRLRSAYLATLWRAIDARVGDVTVGDQDPLVREATEHYFLHGTPEQVSSALELLERLPPEHRRSLLALLLRRTEPEIIAPALEQWAAVATTEERLLASSWLTHSVASVRAAAVKVLAYAPMERVSASLLSLVGDPAPPVRAAVAEGLLRSAHDEHRRQAMAIVTSLSHSAEENDRKLAARVIGTTNLPAFEPVLAALLEDASVVVRVAAIRAVGRGGYGALRPTLYRFLDDHSVYASAVRTLAGLGAPICQDAWKYFAAYPAKRHICHSLTAVLAQVKHPDAVAALEAGLRITDPSLRHQIGLAMMTRIRQGLLGRFPPSVAQQALDDFIDRAMRLDTILSAFSQEERLHDARRILAAERRIAEDAVAVWLSVTYADQPMSDVIAMVRHGNPFQQGNARELLEQVAGVDRAQAALNVLIPDRSRAERLSLSYAVMAALSDPSPWCQIVGAASAVSLNLTQLVPIMRTHAPTGGYVREVWSRAAARLSSDTRSSREPISRDEEGSDDPMWSQVERVMALKAVSLFAGLDVDDIWHLAGIVEEQRLEAGTQILVEGQPGQALSIIMSGEVAVHHGERIITTLRPGDVFGEMSILDEAPVSASVTAITDVTLFRLGSAPFYALLASHFEIARAIIRTLTQRLRQATAT